MNVRVNKTIILLMAFSLCVGFLNAQSSPNRIANIQSQLDSLYDAGVEELKEEVDLSFSAISIQEFIRALAKSTGLNVTIDPAIKLTLSNNFAAEEPLNILLYLCKTYNLDIDIVGTIISFKAHKKEKKQSEEVAKELSITYNEATRKLTVDLRRDTLDNVVKKMAQLTGENIILSPNAQGKLVSGYIKDESLTDVLAKIAYANNLEFINSEGDYFYDFKRKASGANNNSAYQPVSTNRNLSISSRKDDVIGMQLITVEGTNIPIKDIINDVSKRLNKDYFIYSDIQGSITLKLSDISYEDLLRYAFNGTPYTFKNENDVYLLGERNREQIRSTAVIPIVHRSVENILELIPSQLSQDVEIKPFNDLNSLIISGAQPRIEEFEQFIAEIDKRVPMLYLELLIIDFRRGLSVNTGVSAGIADSTVKTSGTFLPGLDMTFGSGSINNFLSFLSNKGIVNLGQVTPSFYVGIQALEEQDRVDIKSTPKLSTLNGQKANLSIGETVYYRVTQSNIIGTQNPQTVVTETFQEAEANMNIEITPFISGDENVTITIDVELSNFQGTPSSNAPPNRFTRQFSSEVRAQNNDLIVLGGLEQSNRSSSGQGLPGVSRVPFFKRLFGKQSKNKSSSQLVVFIMPTIVY